MNRSFVRLFTNLNAIKYMNAYSPRKYSLYEIVR